MSKLNDTSEVRAKNNPYKYLHKNFTFQCKRCGKEYELDLTQQQYDSGKYSKFCSRSCANSRERSLESRKKTSKTFQEKKKCDRQVIIELEDRFITKYKCICCSCGREFLSLNPNVQHCSNKCTGSDPKVREKRSNIFLEKVKNGTHQGWIKRNQTSYPERFWEKVLDNNSIEYKREEYIKEFRYFLDFLIEKDDLKIDLEIDGGQHKLPEHIEHDKLRDKRLTELGYIVYRVEWNDINKEEGSLEMKRKIDDFLNFLKQHNIL